MELHRRFVVCCVWFVGAAIQMFVQMMHNLYFSVDINFWDTDLHGYTQIRFF